MKIAQVMTRFIKSVTPTEGIADAARLMAELDVGALPVEDGGRLVGIITDRDIAVRGLAAGRHSGSPVFQVMSDRVISCREDDDLQDVLAIMARQQIRRMPVCSNDRGLIGIITPGDAARTDPNQTQLADALREICRPRDHHSQSLQAA